METPFEIKWTDYLQYRANMSNLKLTYFDKEDVLHLAITDDTEGGSVEISPDITAELNNKGELIGIEILNASKFIRDAVLESVQVKVLRGLEVSKS